MTGSVRTFAEHTYCVYSASWNPANADIFATASGDCTMKVWDARAPHSTLTVQAHNFEVLSCDWNKCD
jgi:peroxin-7